MVLPFAGEAFVFFQVPDPFANRIKIDPKLLCLGAEATDCSTASISPAPAILDINLGGRPCFPICMILSARRIPFAFLTGYPEAGIPVECRGAPLITKPFEPTEMKEFLAHMFGLAQGEPAREHLPGLRH